MKWASQIKRLIMDEGRINIGIYKEKKKAKGADLVVANRAYASILFGNLKRKKEARDAPTH